MSPSKAHPVVLGFLGGIASGKTTVARMFADLGARVVSADELGHAVLAQPQIRGRIVARWGKEVLDEGGEVDRKKLGRRVFGDGEELRALEAITHPAILAEMRRQIGAARRAAGVAVVVDAPLLMEADLDSLCDALVFLECPREARLARAVARGWDAAELERRERFQRPLEVKRRRASFILESGASLETTFQQVQELWQRLLGQRRKRRKRRGT
jgi:dephospho-CoA kinase